VFLRCAPEVALHECEAAAGIVARRRFRTVTLLESKGPGYETIRLLEGTIEKGIRLLSRGDYRDFVAEVMGPTSRPKNDRELQDLLETAERRGEFERLLKTLKAITDRPPFYYSDGAQSMAVFTFPVDVDGLSTVGFIRVDGRWYMV
jgi:hypothetical protein